MIRPTTRRRRWPAELNRRAPTPADKPEPKLRNADHDGRVRAKEAIAANEKTKPQVKSGTQVDERTSHIRRGSQRG